MSVRLCTRMYGVRSPPKRTDGRITLSLSGESGQEQVDYKYQLLNPATHFRQVLDDARCVILAGGTMSPVRAPTL